MAPKAFEVRPSSEGAKGRRLRKKQSKFAAHHRLEHTHKKRASDARIGDKNAAVEKALGAEVSGVVDVDEIFDEAGESASSEGAAAAASSAGAASSTGAASSADVAAGRGAASRAGSASGVGGVAVTWADFSDVKPEFTGADPHVMHVVSAHVGVPTLFTTLLWLGVQSMSWIPRHIGSCCPPTVGGSRRRPHES
jgi:hypothetical protein